MLDPMLAELLPGFLEEAAEICERVTRALIELEREKLSGEKFDDVARGLHTLKGSAATLGLEALSDFAHKMEDVVLPLRGSEQPLPAPLADAVLRSLDVWLSNLRATVANAPLPDLQPSYELLARSAMPKPEPAAAEPAAAEPGAAEPAAIEAPVRAPQSDNEPAAPVSEKTQPSEGGEATWRVSQRQVTALMREVERFREIRLRIDERKRDLDRMLTALSAPALAAHTTEIRAALTSARRQMASDVEESSDIVSSLEDGLKSISNIPLRTVIEPLRRTVRDLCKASGKEARLSVAGAEISLDRRVLEELRGPLVHLIRNAVDHGLESPEVREARGKNREGLITMRIEQQGNMLFLEIGDDGGGLDVARIRDAALRRGIATSEELAAMTPAQLQQLIFRPGFSTKTEVSDVSGRGVGLDVVIAQLRSLRGTVEVQSTPGQGTRFILTLPAELGSSPVLVVRVGEHQIGVPVAAIESSRLARTIDLRIGRSRVQLAHREQLLPVHDLGALLGLRQPEPPQEGEPLLVVHSQSGRMALGVDEVLGDRELVIRPLPQEVRDVSAWQGAATLARGELVLILRADFLSGAKQSSEQLTNTRRALVVDDSLTARALHRTALEAGGFAVHTAAGGRQALDQLRHTAYDVMVTDIGMPEMDGFQLTQEVRKRPDAGPMPILLVSARDTAADRQRGESAGADGFLTKKDCVSGRLLSEVASVIARRKGASR